jgi:2-polyprenyl-3-methyl-5-hydroxy-6-metoxy-1,4-benzoquinol methylase
MFRRQPRSTLVVTTTRKGGHDVSIVALDQDKLEALVGQIVTDGGAALGILLASVGDDLGLWEALADIGPCTPAALAEATGTNQRMVREWLSAQTAGGYVTYDAEAELFSLSPEQAAVLAGSDSSIRGLFQCIEAWAQVLDKARQAFRTGKGLGWGDHTTQAHVGTERFFRPLYQAELLTSWIPALRGVEAKLRRGAAVADVGCGHGASTIIMATAFPNSTFTGIDFHPPSIERARKLAAESGVADSVTFHVARASELPGDRYDLIAMLDAFHDMDDPPAVAARARNALSPDGTLLLAEPFANDDLTANLNPVGRMFYGSSTLVCTPCSLNDDGLALGNQAGPTRLTQMLTNAGFHDVRVAVETPFNLIIEAKP